MECYILVYVSLGSDSSQFFFFRISTTDYHSSVVDHDRVTLIIFFFFQDVIVFLFIRLVLSCFLVAIYRQRDIILLAIEIS